MKEELMIVLNAVVTGGILRLAYQCIVCLRQIIRHSVLAIGAEDLLFWLGSSLYAFVQIYYTIDGEVRWYFALGVVSGAIFSSFFLRITGKMAKKIYAGMKKLFF